MYSSHSFSNRSIYAVWPSLLAGAQATRDAQLLLSTPPSLTPSPNRLEDPRTITPCTHLLFMAKNVERIGDHCTNIAENVYYIVHGEEIPTDRRKADNSASVNPVPPAE